MDPTIYLYGMNASDIDIAETRFEKWEYISDETAVAIMCYLMNDETLPWWERQFWAQALTDGEVFLSGMSHWTRASHWQKQLLTARHAELFQTLFVWGLETAKDQNPDFDESEWSL